MTHTDFINELQKYGVRSTNTEGQITEFIIPGFFKENSNVILMQNNQLHWDHNDNRDPLKELIKLGIDMGTWKHSWHKEIIPENYQKFQEIIQQRILDRAEEINQLLKIYFKISIESKEKRDKALEEYNEENAQKFLTLLNTIEQEDYDTLHLEI